MKRLLGVTALLAAVAAALAIGLRDRSTPERPAEAEPAVEESREGEPAPLLESEENGLEPETAREELLPANEQVGTSVAPPAPDSAPVRGLLTDSVTGEPLPFYALRLQDSARRREELLTDERGRYATVIPRASGALHFRFLDSRASPRSLPGITREHAVDGGEAPDLDLSVATGPTYRFLITPPDVVPPTELLARLHVVAPDAQVVLDPEPLRMPAAGDDPWVRFAPVPEKFERAETLALESKDGLWVGKTTATAVRGDVPGLLQIRLEARGVVQGLVGDDRGKLILGAQVSLARTTSAGKTATARATTESDGAFRFPALDEGIATLSVRALRHAPQDLEVRIAPGRITTQNVALAPLAPVGAVRGRLESETGTYAPEIEVELRVVESAASSEKRQPRAFEPVSWQVVEGRQVGTFSFEGLPAGRYEVGVVDPGWFTWEPTWAAVSPGEEARFLVHDDLAHGEFAFRVRDSDSGATLDGFHASIQVGSQSPKWKKRGFEVPVLSRFPLERRFTWRVDLEGYRPAIGDGQAFSVEELREGRVWRFAEIALQRGWGEVYRVVSSTKSRPIAGAVVRLDGRDAGTTGADGIVQVAFAEKPRSVEIVHDKWKPSGPVDLRPVGWRREKRYVLVKLAPAPRK